MCLRCDLCCTRVRKYNGPAYTAHPSAHAVAATSSPQYDEDAACSSVILAETLQIETASEMASTASSFRWLRLVSRTVDLSMLATATFVLSPAKDLCKLNAAFKGYLSLNRLDAMSVMSMRLFDLRFSCALTSSGSKICQDFCQNVWSVVCAKATAASSRPLLHTREPCRIANSQQPSCFRCNSVI